jgi:hypothetical protein
MNYTKKTPFLEEQSNKSINFAQIPLDIRQNAIQKEELSLSSVCSRGREKQKKSEALLVNGEIDKPAEKYQKLYERYLRQEIAQYSLTVGNITDNKIEKRRLKKTLSKAEFKLKENNDLLLKKTNVSLFHCNHQAHFQNIDGVVGVKETKTSRNLKGLKSCGSHSACPVCASKLSFIRGNELSNLMEVGRDNDRSYMMIVTTIPHQPLEPLQTTQLQNDDLSTYIFNSKEWKKLKKTLSCRFVHGGRENMVSVKNGRIDWHPHKNYLLDFDIPIKEIMKRLDLKSDLDLRMYFSKLFTKIGQRYLDNKGIDKRLLEPYFWQNPETNQIHVKGGVSASIEFDDKYITKWGLDAEMTAGIYKDGRFSDSFHPFGLLDLIHEENKETNEAQKYMFIKAFQEFVLATKGKRWFYFGRGSVDYYNENYGSDIKNQSDEVALKNMEDDGSLLIELDDVEWKLFKPTPKKIGTALSRRSKDEVLIFIFDEIEKNRIIEYERKIE